MNTNIQQRNPVSTKAFKDHYKTDKPKRNIDKILKAVIEYGKPFTYDKAAELSGVDRGSMGQYIGRRLVSEGFVFKVKEKKGVSKNGNVADLYVTAQFLQKQLQLELSL